MNSKAMRASSTQNIFSLAPYHCAYFVLKRGLHNSAHLYRGGATITKYLASIQSVARPSTIHGVLLQSKIFYV